MKARLFAASMSGQSFIALRHDQWIEMTINKSSKMKGVWIGINQNEEALHTNTKVVKIIAKFKESVKVIADVSKRRYKHIERLPSSMKKDEEAVQGAMKHCKSGILIPGSQTLPHFDFLNLGCLHQNN